jgi:hypothetical protein
VKAVNSEGVTPLSMAALYGNAAMIDRLVKAGADAKQRGPNGETMIMLAARNGKPAGAHRAHRGGRGRQRSRVDPGHHGADVGCRTEASRSGQGAPCGGGRSHCQVGRRRAPAQLHRAALEPAAPSCSHRIAGGERRPRVSRTRSSSPAIRSPARSLAASAGWHRRLGPTVSHCRPQPGEKARLARRLRSRRLRRQDRRLRLQRHPPHPQHRNPRVRLRLVRQDRTQEQDGVAARRRSGWSRRAAGARR